jgi:hypothetical protein
MLVHAENQDLGVFPALFDAGDQFQAAAAGQRYIGNHQVRLILLK